MIVEKHREGDYHLTILYDEDVTNPRTEYEQFGKMICWHNRYSLGDKHDFHSPSEFLISVLAAHVGDPEHAERLFDRMRENADQEAKPIGSDRFQMVENNIIQCVRDSHVILPLYLYDHSVQSMSTESFVGRAQHAEWDSGRVGLYCASKADVEREYGAWNADTRKNAENLMKAEVSAYDCYLRGECYRFELREGSELVDSVGGFLGELDDAKRAMLSHVPMNFEDALLRPERAARGARSSELAM